MAAIGITGDDGAFTAPIATDPEDVRAEIHAELQARQPGWEPLPAQPDTHLIASIATSSAEARASVVAQLRSELLTLLGTLFAVPRRDGSAATSTITVTAGDLIGHTLPAGVTVWLGDVELETSAELTIPGGDDTGVVPVSTILNTSEANGATGTIEIDTEDWIDSVTLDAPLAGGEDPETEAEYSVRLAEELQLLTQEPIQPADFAVIARRHPSVAYSWAINLYDATTDLDDQERTVTVVIADASGADPGPVVRADVLAMLQVLREVNFVIRVVAPTPVPVDVEFAIVPHAGWVQADREDATIERLQGVLSPPGWIQPPFGADAGHVPTRRIHKNELIAQADQVEGVDYVDDLIIGDGSTDFIDLDRLELPVPGAISVIV